MSATTERVRIVFVDDEPEILEGLRDLLRRRRDRWDMSFHDGAAAALTALDAGSVDVIVTDVRMPGTDGVALLEQVERLHPDVVRIILSGQVEPRNATRAGLVAHRVLGKPCAEPEIARAVQESLEVRARLREEGLRLAVTGIGELPRAPQVVLELCDALAHDRTGAAELARIASRDVILTARLLGLVNSAYFGVPRTIVRLEEAIAFLGVSTVEAVALEHGVLTVAGPRLPSSALEAFEAHARFTGRIARDVVGSRELGSAAFAGGLLHDVGALLLASADRGAHRARLLAAADAGLALHEVETRERGACHAATGGRLLALWGLPAAVVEAVACHHAPDAASGPPLVRAVALAERLAHRLEDPGTTAIYRHGDPAVWGADAPVGVPELPDALTRLWAELGGAVAPERAA
ncbi:HDOD domain-containing protein [Conexibacter sp. W3-3-2]|uniref:HDOD domain-containing protein n=1 Tax=Conexibacter sp. W3-3-2 TaxID=2675227 RepID=UPI0012B75F86|nr:HDOD domain-containing protein [Conexibacter sp. W3-3-2]MTD43437.1 HDOD domain-containing protein [Conexibacter sp. W3-3-2]